MVKLQKRDIIELILLIIILAIIMVIVFKTLVISSLVGKARNYEAYANAYERVEFENSTKVKSYNIYKKDNLAKAIIYKKNGGRVIKYIEYEDASFDLPSDETNIELENYSNRKFNIGINYFSSDTIWDIINSALICKFKNEKIDDGTKCYVFENMYNKQDLNSAGISNVKLYIAKKSGLPVQRVEENLDGSTNIVKFTFEFNKVTDKDVKNTVASIK